MTPELVGIIGIAALLALLALRMSVGVSMLLVGLVGYCYLISEEADRVKPLFFYSFSPPWPTFLQLFPIHLSVPSSTIYPLRLGLPNQK